MAIVAVPNSDEPPLKKPRPSPQSSPSSLFTSLPNELILDILARVSKRYHPIVACVCKSLASLVRSPEIHRIRSLLGLDSLYICFIDKTHHSHPSNWFTLRKIKNNPNENVVVSIGSPSHPDLNNSSVIAIGPEIFFVSGSCIPSSSFCIFDSRSGEFRRGPNMLVKRLYNSVGQVGGKIYVIGGYRDDEVRAESFDLKKRIWEVAKVPEEKGSQVWVTMANACLDRKVYALGVLCGMTCYDTRDGSCERFELPDDKWWKRGLCVMENVLYVYYARFGLMWFDTELVLWRVVFGLSNLKKVRSVGMAEYYGKLAFLWKESGFVRGETKEVWCRMIVLDRSEVGICGTAEPAQLLGSVPRRYRLQHCLSVSD